MGRKRGAEARNANAHGLRCAPIDLLRMWHEKIEAWILDQAGIDIPKEDGKLTSTRHHCHLKKGQPTYVAVWEVVNQEIRLIEVIYADTHEKAPY